MGIKRELIRALWDADYQRGDVSCAEIAIEIDKALYPKLLAQAAASGAKFDGDKAEISGLEFLWSYDPETGTLRITCTKKPWYIGCGQVAAKIMELIEKAKAEAI